MSQAGCSDALDDADIRGGGDCVAVAKCSYQPPTLLPEWVLVLDILLLLVGGAIMSMAYDVREPSTNRH